MNTNLKKLSQILKVGKASQVKCLSCNAKFVYIINYIIMELIGEGNHLIEFNLALVTAMLLVILINISSGSASLFGCFPCCFCTSIRKYWIFFFWQTAECRELYLPEMPTERSLHVRVHRKTQICSQRIPLKGNG